MAPEHRDAGPPRGIPPVERRPEQEPQAWRLTFEYDSRGIALVAQQRVATTAPPDDSALTYAARAGYWVEVRDATGHGLYRQVLANPIRTHFEAHTRVPGGRPESVATPARTKGAFQVVLPDLPEAHDVVLHGVAAPGPARTRRSRTQETAQPILTATLAETEPYGGG
jgi:hypothetical protein